MKKCSKCNQTKPLSEFRQDKQGRNTNSSIYYRPECKECEKRLREQYNKAKKNASPQPLICECCGAKAKLVVDHCHKTGKFRGWLCQRCNQGIGKLGDDLNGVKKAYKYLKGSWWKRMFNV
jgi:hypothetical protein